MNPRSPFAAHAIHKVRLAPRRPCAASRTATLAATGVSSLIGCPHERACVVLPWLEGNLAFPRETGVRGGTADRRKCKHKNAEFPQFENLVKLARVASIAPQVSDGTIGTNGPLVGTAFVGAAVVDTPRSKPHASLPP